MRLAGKVAFVSGGARGMGAAEARLFAREGAHVAFGDVLDEEGRKVEAEINEMGGRALYVHLDVTRPESWQAAMDATIEAFGRLDVLVNNAGVLVDGTRDDATIENWDRVMDVNAKGVFLGVMAAIPHMRAAGGGSIINISSISGIIGQEPHPRRIQRLQGRGEAAHQIDRHPVRERGHPRKLGASRWWWRRL